MVHNAPLPPLRPGDTPMNPVNTATYLGVQQAATTNRVTLPTNLIRQLTQTLVIAPIVELSTQALAYFTYDFMRHKKNGKKKIKKNF